MTSMSPTNPAGPSSGKSMNSLRLVIAMTCLMVFMAIAGIVVRPPAKPVGAAPKYLLEDIVPRQFGEWKEVPTSTAVVVNPETKQLLDKLYSQMLTRTYVHTSGYRIMLVLAYGDDQRGELQAHLPEVCYPAQGFSLHARAETQLATPFGNIGARRLDTSNGARKEPITYWFTVGETPVKSKFDQRMVEIRLGLSGQIPDGLLFRISSIDAMPAHAYQLHDAFVTELLQAVPSRDRTRLSGLKGNGSG
jgi:EpsI family protein